MSERFRPYNSAEEMQRDFPRYSGKAGQAVDVFVNEQYLDLTIGVIDISSTDIDPMQRDEIRESLDFILNHHKDDIELFRIGPNTVLHYLTGQNPDGLRRDFTNPENILGYYKELLSSDDIGAKSKLI